MSVSPEPWPPRVPGTKLDGLSCLGSRESSGCGEDDVDRGEGRPGDSILAGG